VVLSLLLGALVFVLGTGRARAVALVRERTRQLRFQAFHDPLTGLANRSLILDRAEQMLARSRRERTQVAVLFLDLDNFKVINDTLGHEAGDQLLEAVGSRLQGALRAGDTVGRLGGDEFVVLVDGPSLASGVGVVAHRMLALFDTPFDIAASEVPYPVTVSIGIAEDDGGSADDLLRDADVALYRAKEAGKERALLFNSSMQEAVEERRRLERDLHTALHDDQFFLQYQPIVDLTSGAISGVEALLRWRHPDRGVVQPDAFIPVLEANGLIVPVGKWVLETACRQGARWLEQGHRIDLSVNLSGRQVEREQLVDDVRGALDASGLDPAVLVLELTETSLMHEVETIVARLDLLKALGLRVAIDDFGMGYSSISYLQQFPVDILKIDQSFVSRIAESPASAALVHTLVQLAKVLGLVTVAEGIETEEQLTSLRAEMVDYGQGYLMSRPVDVPAIDRLLATSTLSDALTRA
jgi:diguanylate cyclase (GGDEF)-like protein